jgi:hypothetical protein
VKKYTDIEEAQLVLLELLKNRLFHKPLELGENVDWSRVFQESYMQGVHVTLFSNCRGLDIPSDIMEKMKPIIRKYMIRDFQVAGGHSALHRIMTAEKIPYCIIKGIASANYYPDVSLRSLGDVDFLIDEGDKDRVLEIMTANGYTIHEEEDSHHVVLENKGIRLELHMEPPGMPKGESSAYAKQYMSHILQEAGVTENPVATCKCPSEFHHGLIILMHTVHHMLGEGVGLRHICDWAVFLEHMGDNFQEVFEEPLRHLGLWKFASLLSLLSARYLGATPCPWMPDSEEDEAIAYSMLMDVFAGGNFGYKDKDRQYEGMFISDRGKSGVKGNRISDGFRSLNSIAGKKWPLCKKIPILLPIGWMIAVLGFFKRNHERKKKGGGVHVQEVYKKSLHRRNIYESLEIYDSEDGVNS